jgi:hypothetical protein
MRSLNLLPYPAMDSAHLLIYFIAVRWHRRNGSSILAMPFPQQGNRHDPSMYSLEMYLKEILKELFRISKWHWFVSSACLV